jgi:hypothetical protein
MFLSYNRKENFAIAKWRLNKPKILNFKLNKIAKKKPSEKHIDPDTQTVKKN